MLKDNDKIIPRFALGWRNWQTRMVEGHVEKSVGVRVPPRVPAFALNEVKREGCRDEARRAKSDINRFIYFMFKATARRSQLYFFASNEVKKTVVFLYYKH